MPQFDKPCFAKPWFAVTSEPRKKNCFLFPLTLSFRQVVLEWKRRSLPTLWLYKNTLVELLCSMLPLLSIVNEMCSGHAFIAKLLDITLTCIHCHWKMLLYPSIYLLCSSPRHNILQWSPFRKWRKCVVLGLRCNLPFSQLQIQLCILPGTPLSIFPGGKFSC